MNIKLHVVKPAQFMQVLKGRNSPSSLPSLKRTRRYWRISLRELSIVSGYTVGTIAHYEFGKYHKPSCKAVWDLWQSLGMLIAERTQARAV